MNRAIKFRGLRIDSTEWVYGSLVNNLWCYSANSKYPGQQVCEIITDQHSVDDYEEMQDNNMNVTVDPKSVGQFTGLKDKNGKEIYEGDICATDTGKAMVVTWDNRFASFCLSRDGWAFRHWFGEACNPEHCTVIGNIYQNPDLLESEASHE